MTPPTIAPTGAGFGPGVGLGVELEDVHVVVMVEVC